MGRKRKGTPFHHGGGIPHILPGLLTPALKALPQEIFASIVPGAVGGIHQVTERPVNFLHAEETIY
jgi:hypothetical protein